MKLIAQYENPQSGVPVSCQLFYLASDPTEQIDLAAKEDCASAHENMINLMIDARCALEDQTEPDNLAR